MEYGAVDFSAIRSRSYNRIERGNTKGLQITDRPKGKGRPGGNIVRKVMVRDGVLDIEAVCQKTQEVLKLAEPGIKRAQEREAQDAVRREEIRKVQFEHSHQRSISRQVFVDENGNLVVPGFHRLPVAGRAAVYELSLIHI